MPFSQQVPEPERAFALQKYMLLHQQHDALAKHVSSISPSLHGLPSTSPTRSSASPSPSSSPSSNASLYAHRPSDPGPSIAAPTALQKQQHRRRFSLPALGGETLGEEIEEDVEKLKECNQAIKSTLTTLLNCETVKGDRRYCKWVQSRLMDAENELREGRSRTCGRKRSEDLLL